MHQIVEDNIKYDADRGNDDVENVDERRIEEEREEGEGGGGGRGGGAGGGGGGGRGENHNSADGSDDVNNDATYDDVSKLLHKQVRRVRFEVTNALKYDKKIRTKKYRRIRRTRDRIL